MTVPMAMGMPMQMANMPNMMPVCMAPVGMGMMPANVMMQAQVQNNPLLAGMMSGNSSIIYSGNNS